MFAQLSTIANPNTPEVVSLLDRLSRLDPSLVQTDDRQILLTIKSGLRLHCYRSELNDGDESPLMPVLLMLRAALSRYSLELSLKCTASGATALLQDVSGRYTQGYHTLGIAASLAAFVAWLEQYQSC